MLPRLHTLGNVDGGGTPCALAKPSLQNATHARCQTHPPHADHTPTHLAPQGDFCINCGAPFIRSFVTFEHLPLVEFELDRDISDEEAKRLLGEDAGASRRVGFP